MREAIVKKWGDVKTMHTHAVAQEAAAAEALRAAHDRTQFLLGALQALHDVLDASTPRADEVQAARDAASKE